MATVLGPCIEGAQGCTVVVANTHRCLLCEHHVCGRCAGQRDLFARSTASASAAAWENHVDGPRTVCTKCRARCASNAAAPPRESVAAAPLRTVAAKPPRRKRKPETACTECGKTRGHGQECSQRLAWVARVAADKQQRAARLAARNPGGMDSAAASGVKRKARAQPAAVDKAPTAVWQCILGCGCEWTADGERVTANCALQHTDTSGHAESAQNGGTRTTNGVKCIDCARSGVCSTPGCLCSQPQDNTGAPEESRDKVVTIGCALHVDTVTRTVPFSRLGTSRCGCCERKCVTCLCTELSSKNCKARRHTALGRKKAESDHEETRAPFVSRKDGKLTCAGCKQTPMCRRCWKTASHSEYSDASTANGAATIKARPAGSLVQRGFRFPAAPAHRRPLASGTWMRLACACCVASLPLTLAHCRRVAQTNAFGEPHLSCQACVAKANASRDRGRALRSAAAQQALDESSGDRVGNSKICVTWASLNLVQWGALLCWLEKRCDRDGEFLSLAEADESEGARLSFLVKASARCGVLDSDARRTGRTQGHELTSDALHFMSSQMSRPQARGTASRGLPSVVRAMSDALLSATTGGDVCVNVTALRAELTLRESLRAQLRGSELRMFATRM